MNLCNFFYVCVNLFKVIWTVFLRRPFALGDNFDKMIQIWTARGRPRAYWDGDKLFRLGDVLYFIRMLRYNILRALNCLHNIIRKLPSCDIKINKSHKALICVFLNIKISLTKLMIKLMTI